MKEKLFWKKRHKLNKKRKERDPDTQKIGRLYHTQKRAQERYHLSLGKSDIEKISALIQKHKAQRIFEKGKPTKLYSVEYLVEFGGKKLLVIFDWQNLEVVTVLPNENI